MSGQVWLAIGGLPFYWNCAARVWSKTPPSLWQWTTTVVPAARLCTTNGVLEPLRTELRALPPFLIVALFGTLGWDTHKPFAAAVLTEMAETDLQSVLSQSVNTPLFAVLLQLMPVARLLRVAPPSPGQALLQEWHTLLFAWLNASQNGVPRSEAALFDHYYTVLSVSDQAARIWCHYTRLRILVIEACCAGPQDGAIDRSVGSLSRFTAEVHALSQEAREALLNQSASEPWA